MAAALIEAREKSGMTQAEVANKMGVSQPVIARLESEHNISMRTLKRYVSDIGQPISLIITPNKLVVS